jgi:ubiquitin carboxyl-terminal hydrolase 34
MDPATSTSDSPPQRAPSSEPVSTRPNPFDEGEVAARKRRRTSGSGDSLIQLRINGDEPSPDQAMTMDPQTSAPRTPEDSPCHDSQRADPPSSSNVTINLRKALFAHQEDSAPPPLPERADPNLRSHTAADAAASAEDELEQSYRERAASPTGSSSPPIELVQDGDDDDLDIQDTIEDISLSGPDFNLSRKIQVFPFRDSTEHPHETADRLVTYVSSSK